jgi:WD40 repeat protein
MTPILLSPQAFAKQVTFGEPRLHTDSDVQALRFDKDGWLYTIEELGILRKWNAANGQQIQWCSLSDMETLWAFSADARILASASDDLAIWDASSGAILTSIPQPTWVTALCFHPDASFIATGYDDGAIGYWDAPGHHAVFEKNLAFHKKAISAVAISPNGKTLAAASEDKTISLWDLATGKYIGNLAGHTDRVPALVWHPSGKFLVSAGWDATARIWDAATLQPVILFNSHATQVNAIAFSRDGRWLASADSASTIHVWDFDARKTVHKLKVNEGEIRALDFSADGQYLACNGDRMVHLWSPQTGKSYGDLGPRATAKTTVSLQADRLLTNGGGGAVRIWNSTSRQLATSLDSAEPIHGLAFSPDGKWIAGGVGNKIRLWDAAGKHLVDWDGPDAPVTTLAFSPDGTTLASGSSNDVSVWIWRVADGEAILLIPDALDGCSIESLAFLPDGRTIAVGGIDWMATGGSNGAVCLWNLDQRAEVATFLEGATAIAVHPSGDLLASSTTDHAICLWDLNVRQLAHELIGHEGNVSALAFSPDGRWLASGAEDNFLRLWDTKGNEKAAQELESQVTSIVFSPDAQFIYTGHANTTCSQIQLPEALRRK